MKPFQLGVTGGIGSGKSVICDILSAMGIPIYNADDSSKKLLENSTEVVQAVTELLGNEAYLPGGKADRGFIAGVVFNKPDMLLKLNAILHPAVQQHYRNWVTQQAASPIVVKEAAIMFESGAFREMDAIIVVTAPEALRIKRVIDRDGKSGDEVRKIISNQLPEREVVGKSDFEIVNDEQQLVIPQVLQILQQINTRIH